MNRLTAIGVLVICTLLLTGLVILNKDHVDGEFVLHPTDFKIYNAKSNLFRDIGHWTGLYNIALLTFDDGPNRAIDENILAILDEQNAKSLWFINCNKLVDHQGKPIQDAIDMVNEIARRGHLIGNHGFNHKRLEKLSIEEIRFEIIECSNTIERLTGNRPRYFRPPFGVLTQQGKTVANEDHMQIVQWTVNSYDSLYNKGTPDSNSRIINHLTLARATQPMHNGANILFHDYAHTAAVLEEILIALKKSGYQFVVPGNQEYGVQGADYPPRINGNPKKG